MRVHATIIAISTINTDTLAAKQNQPMVEILLELLPEGATKPTAIKFTEMLSNLAGKGSTQTADYLAAIVASYVKTAFAGEALLDPSKEWIDTARFLGTEYNVTV